MQSVHYIGKMLAGNSATGQNEKSIARLEWEISQHKKLEERAYAVLSFLAAVVDDHNGDSELTLDANARQGLRFVFQDLQGRLAGACYSYAGANRWRGSFYQDDYFGSPEEYEGGDNE